jgi:hypothetical protein
MKIETPTREELVAAWHRRSPNLTYEQADTRALNWVRSFCCEIARLKRAI